MTSSKSLAILSAGILLALNCHQIAIAQDRTSMTSPAPTSQPFMPWNFEQLSIAPRSYPADGYADADATAVFLEGPSYRGKPTRFFAWYGVPKSTSGKKNPAMVLVHGGGGTAHLHWVKQWVALGYAAIAIDTSATMPSLTGGEPLPNPQGGPKGSDHCFTQLDDPIEDQWAFHATADIVLAHSFLRNLPGVDPERIGITGISWGGYLTCIAIGIDPRFKFAVPVYGCGFLVEDSAWSQRFAEMDSAKRELWKKYWDPAQYLPRATAPILWINGDMDGAFSLKITRLSSELAKGERYLSIHPAMPHSHESGEAPPEIAAFAEQVLHNGRRLARCTATGHTGRNAWATFQDAGKPNTTRCAYTADQGPWMGRKWTVIDATWNQPTAKAFCTIPENSTAYYFVLTDDRGLMASSQPRESDQAKNQTE